MRRIMFQKGIIALTLLVCPLMASAQFLLWDDFLEPSATSYVYRYI